jgi:hypothetical protein
VRERLKPGPLIVLAGAAGLLVVSLMTWYRIDLGKIAGGGAVITRYATDNDFATGANAWEPWGLLPDLVLLLVIGAGLLLPLAAISGRLTGLRPALGAIVTGALGTALVLLHIISGPEPHDIVSVQFPAWLGLLCCLAMLGGGFLWWDRVAHPRAAPEPAV